jgi:hypothetical protein
LDSPALLAAQNPDGGWPYAQGSSRVEPTVFALLALGREREGASATAAGRALGWLRIHQRPDGGWAPAPPVAESTWVTALPLLLGPERLGAEARARAGSWLLRQTGADATFWYRVRQTLGGRPAERFEGWPWFPGTAAWVAPTAFAILALRSLAPRHPRLAAGCRFLLSRRCGDGGWNYGGARALGYESASYPETTGLALVALPPAAELAPSLEIAERHLSHARSAEAIAWLHLALRAHGRDPGPWPAATVRPRTWRDVALCLMASTGAMSLG